MKLRVAFLVLPSVLLQVIVGCMSTNTKEEYLDRILPGAYSDPGEPGPPSTLQTTLVFNPDSTAEIRTMLYDPDTLANGEIVYERPVLLSVSAGTWSMNGDSADIYLTKMGSVFDKNRLTDELIDGIGKHLRISPSPYTDTYLFRKITKQSFEAVNSAEVLREWVVWKKVK
jgi:hypothetical protein